MNINIIPELKIDIDYLLNRKKAFKTFSPILDNVKNLDIKYLHIKNKVYIELVKIEDMKNYILKHHCQ